MQIEPFDLLKEALNKQDPEQELIRLNLVFCIFCKCPPNELVAPGQALLDAFQKSFGESINYISAGATSSKFSKFGKSGWNRARREIESAEKKDLTALKLRGPNARGPDYSLVWLTDDECAREDYKGANFIEIVVPLNESAIEWDIWFRRLAAAFPIDTGYASPALMFCQEAKKDDAGEIMADLG